MAHFRKTPLAPASPPSKTKAMNNKTSLLLILGILAILATAYVVQDALKPENKGLTIQVMGWAITTK